MLLSILKSTTKKVTEQEHAWLPKEESFSLFSIDVSIENESLRIDFHQLGDEFSLGIFDKDLNKSVSLSFDFFGENSALVIVNFWKQKRTPAFWKKPRLQIGKAISYEVNENQSDENIKFVWDRVPEFLINLK